mgnify:FL=1
MKKHLSILLAATVGMLIIFYTESCKKIKYVDNTSTDLNIYGYIKSNPDKYSSITAIVDKSG